MQRLRVVVSVILAALALGLLARTRQWHEHERRRGSLADSDPHSTPPRPRAPRLSSNCWSGSNRVATSAPAT